MRPYSNDLRRRIVEVYQTDEYSQPEVAELFGVSVATVKNFVRRQRETGSADALPHGGGRTPTLSDQARRFVRQIITERNDMTLDEVSQRVKQKYKKKVSRPTMCRLLQALGLPRKKKSLHSSERDTPRVKRARRAYQQQVSQLDVKRFNFVDESGVNLAMTRLYGRAPAGERAVGSVPINYGANLTVIAALGLAGLDAVMTVEGATDGDVFRIYVERILCPTLRGGDIVAMDRLCAHRVEAIRPAIEACGAKLIYLPPYSLDLSPIEQCWSKIKAALRAIGARTRRALERAITQVLSSITDADALAWFAHCGYQLN